jgi:hypothetical protein
MGSQRTFSLAMKIDLHFRRCHDRLALTCPVIYAGVPYVGEGLILNLSSRGCSVEGMQTVLNGSYMKLGLLLSDSALSLRIDLAAVRWVTGSCFGVEFLRLSVEELERLDRLLEGFRVGRAATPRECQPGIR